MSYILFACYGNQQAEKAAAILRREEGQTVVITSDGKEAMEVIVQKGEVPSVLFAHVLLPNMDGIELLCVFREKYPTAKTKILLRTHICANSFACRDWTWPVAGYMMNPYSAEQLVLSVEQLLYRDVTMPKTKEAA